MESIYPLLIALAVELAIIGIAKIDKSNKIAQFIIKLGEALKSG